MQAALKSEVMFEHKPVRTVNPRGNGQVPCIGFLLFIERFFNAVEMPGGRILLLLMVAAAFYAAVLLGVREAVWPGSVCLLAFVRLARNPRNAPGVLRKLLRRNTTT
jgi:hypothetical protein